MLATPSAGIVRANPDIKPMHCLECGSVLAVYPNYPHGRPEWRCVHRDCRLAIVKPAVIRSTVNDWSV